MDIDRATLKYQQGVKKVVQDVSNVGRAATKPAKRTKLWLTKVVNEWRDRDENAIKEKMTDPHKRSALYKAARTLIKYGGLFWVGLLWNPLIVGIMALRKIDKHSKEFRIRNEIIGELKTEMEIIDEKIKDADGEGDKKAKYRLMRLKNELNKKLIRVGGGKGIAKLI